MTAQMDRIQEGILLSLYHGPLSRDGCAFVDTVFQNYNNSYYSSKLIIGSLVYSTVNVSDENFAYFYDFPINSYSDMHMWQFQCKSFIRQLGTVFHTTSQTIFVLYE